MLTIRRTIQQDPALLPTELKKLWLSFVRLFYPASCIFCHQSLQLEEQQYACSHCINQMPILKTPLCAKCSTELPPYGPSRSLCNRCLRQKTYYHRSISIFRYETDVKRLIQKVKFSRKSWYLKTVSEHLGRIETPFPISDYDLVVPVPLDLMRKKEREFNQSAVLAKLLQKKRFPETLIRDIIRKTKRTKPQSILRREERLGNLINAFCLKRGVKIEGKKILLIDDVMTTGATLNECAKCLIQNGAERVDVFSLARTIFQ